MHATLDDLVLALYVTIDDLFRTHPEQLPARPKIGFVPKITDAELIPLAVMAALAGYTCERRWLRHAHQHLTSLFPYLPGQSGYNRRLRKLAPTMRWLIATLGADTTIVDDDVWVVDSTPVECARSRETVKRSDLAGFAEYGYCASHSRFFWGLRLHLVCTLHGLPVGWALTGAKADERETLGAILAELPIVPGGAGRQMLIADKNYFGREFETALDHDGIDLLRPARKGETPRAGAQFFKPLRQIVESVNQTLKGQLDLERHGGRTPAGVCTRIAQRILALTADLAQRPPRRHHPTLTDRLRPLTLESII